MTIQIAAFITIMSILIGLCLRHKAMYGIIAILGANVFRVYSDVGDDLWFASFFFMMLGALICTICPLKAEMQNAENKKEG